MKETCKIKKIKAREILDSRGNPTVKVELITNRGLFKASVPSGASKGKYEAVELRDGGRRYQGLGVLKAVNNINKIISPKLRGREVIPQKEIDEFLIRLDGTKNKSKLGANSILAVSMAICRAGAFVKDLPLYRYIGEIYRGLTPEKFKIVCPQPAFNVINGGAHARTELDFQEFMIVPRKIKVNKYPASRFFTFGRLFRIGREIYQELKKIIRKKYGSFNLKIGDEGGFVPPLKRPEEAIELILAAAKNLGYQDKIKIIIDVAASQFFLGRKYQTNFRSFSSEELVDYYLYLIKKYPILGLEDPFAENDWRGWQLLNSKLEMGNSKLLIIGDDLLATNPQRMKLARKKGICNAVIIKPNQIGSVTEAIEATQLAKSYGWKVIVSHRSGETMDDFIADFATGVEADFIKAGAPFPKERMAKYNRLLKIEKENQSSNSE